MMKEYDLNLLIQDKELLNSRIAEFTETSVIRRQKPESAEIRGHIEKAVNNLNFVKDNLKLGYHDWCITGCYYASYHAVLALLMTKGYVSRSHLATLCLLIKEFYKKGIDKEDIELVDGLFIDYQDLLFYVESKNKREDATYSSKRQYGKQLAESLRLKAVLFVNKVKGMVNSAK
ncbi:HEPN domain-containing protein [Candidatus Woesearchaeota archaeon]|nr:HEPN domain-containing protein [Candidatus Woesearchaeota archaeon]